MELKIKGITAAVTAMCIFTLSGCAADGNSTQKGDADSAVNVTLNESDSDNTHPMISGEERSSAPFESYSTEIKGTKENYILTVSRGEYPSEISVVIENNRYESKSFIITAPYGFEPAFPSDSASASSVMTVISNDIDSSYTPDIMQIPFFKTTADDDKPGTVCKFYTIDGGELRELRICENTALDEQKVYDYLDTMTLIHTEPDKFISRIIVDDTELYDDDGEPVPPERRVRIITLTLDPKEMTLELNYEKIDEDNPLYFGYAYWAAANSLAQNFINGTFNISDFDNHKEIAGSYYFVIDDQRFRTTDDLKDYLSTVFSDQLSETIFAEAPQKYCDLDGKLYGIAGEGNVSSGLGVLSFTDMEIKENRMVFRSRQERISSSGGFEGYTDGGNFVIEYDDETERWKVTKYRYPFS